MKTKEKKLTFRPLEFRDYALLKRWLAEPHVAKWWNESADLAAIEKKYAPRVRGTEPTHVFVILCETHPIGWVQWYRWSDYPDHAQEVGAEGDAAGIDIAIGEQSWVGQGLGGRAIRQFLDEIVYTDASLRSCLTDPDSRNTRSLAAFAKAGFTQLRSVLLKNETSLRHIISDQGRTHLLSENGRLRK